MKQLLFILNPTAGTKAGERRLAEIISVFNKSDYATRVYVTVRQGDAVKAVKQLGSDVDMIVCCGGDGTLNEIVTGVIEAGISAPIGYIPAGTTNDFATSLGLPTDVIKAAERVVEGSVEEYDAGRFLDRYFVYVASFGLFTKSSYTTKQAAKNYLGHLAYLLDGIRELSAIRKERIRIELDGTVIEDDFWFGAVCNSTSVGRVISFDKNAVDMSDGMFEVFLLRAPKDLAELHETIIALTNQKYNSKTITIRSARSIKIFSDPSMLWSLDGEKADGKNEITIENLHRYIKLIR